MLNRAKRIGLIASVHIILLSGCTADKAKPFTGGYPPEIGEIFLTRCAVTGCHTDASKNAASGLSLSSWDNLMAGGRNGAVVIPYLHTQSTLFLFTNSYEDLGVSVPPIMPFNEQPLSREEVLNLRYWINSGAPNDRNEISFSNDPNRRKYYVMNKGCDLVAAIDQQTDLVMRYIEVGNSFFVEFPNEICLAPDEQHWYVTFAASDVIEKYRTTDDKKVGSLYLGFGEWNTLCISSDSKYAFVVNSEPNGKIAIVDLDNMSLVKLFDGNNSLVQPHGVCVNQATTSLYVTSPAGNFIHKLDISDLEDPVLDTVVLETGQPAGPSPALDPGDMFIYPDGSRYYITCRNAAAVRVFDAATDSLLHVIPVGAAPERFCYEPERDYLFVANTEDTISYPGKIGSISVIDCATNKVIKQLYPGSQPRGLAIDDVSQRLIVVNRNFAAAGPAPHHVTECAGRNGYLTYVDLNTLELIPGMKFEVSVDPYAAFMR